MLSVSFFMDDLFSYPGLGSGLTLGLSFLSCLISFLAEVILWFILGLVWVQV